MATENSMEEDRSLADYLSTWFMEDTNKTIQQTFSNLLELLEKKCKRNYGIVENNFSKDLCAKFKALPAFPIILRFNDADDLYPATSAFLLYDDASRYLDLKSLATIATYLTGLLIQNCSENLRFMFLKIV